MHAMGEQHADQYLLLEIGEFVLDLHNTERRVAKQVVRRRIVECHRYGLRVLKVVFGSPPDFTGSIAEAVFELVRSSEFVAQEMLPSFVFLSCPQPNEISTSIKIYLHKNSNPEQIKSDTKFDPFTPKFESDIGHKLRCRTPYQPLRVKYTLEWTARAIRNGCTVPVLDTILRRMRRAEPLSWADVCELARRYELSQQGGVAQLPKDTPIESSPFQVVAGVGDVRPKVPVELPESTLAKAGYLEERSHYKDAEQVLTEFLTGQTDKTHKQIEDATLMLGRVYMAINNDAAETTLLRVRDLRLKRVGEKHPSLLPILQALMDYYQQSGEPERGLQVLTEISAIALEHLDSPGVNQVVAGTLRAAYYEQSVGNQMQSLVRLRWLALWLDNRRLQPGDDASRFDLLGQNYLELGCFVESRVALQAALRISEEHKVPIHRRCHVLMQWGRLMRKLQRFDDAVAAYRKAMLELATDTDEQDFLLATLHSSLGVSLKYSGKYDDAEREYETALRIFQQCDAEEHPEYARVLVSKAVLLMETDRGEQAERIAKDALAIVETKIGSHPQLISSCYGTLSRIAAKIGKTDEANDYYNRGIASCGQTWGTQSGDRQCIGIKTPGWDIGSTQD
jgi:tetratricopeptide (TPR) repeat protein